MLQSDHCKGSVLCVGPRGMPRTGQSLATDVWTEHSSLEIIPINNNFEGLSVAVRLFRTFALPFLVMRKTRRERPTVMYLSLKRSFFGLLADLACVRVYRSVVSGPVVVHLHGADLVSARRSRIVDAIVRWLWASVSDVIVLTPRMAEQLDGLPQCQAHVVPNFSEKFLTADEIAVKAKLFLNGPLKVLYLSNLMYSKGFSHLTDAVRSLRKGGLAVELILAGTPLGDEYLTGEEAKVLLNAALGDGIEFVGPIYGAQKWEMLKSAHVLALPTFYTVEAQPISVIEGMACGCIPLTTRHNYNEDFLDPSVAYLVEKQSSEAIAEALRKIAEGRKDEAKRMQRAWSMAIEIHSLERYVESVDRVVSAAETRTTTMMQHDKRETE